MEEFRDKTVETSNDNLRLINFSTLSVVVLPVVHHLHRALRVAKASTTDVACRKADPQLPDPLDNRNRAFVGYHSNASIHPYQFEGDRSFSTYICL